ncbi:hypothetical protein HDZ31DRAFT_62078 [Schizophyllum fasciatum]
MPIGLPGLHPWDDPEVSPEASQHDGNFAFCVRRRVKVNVAGLPLDYPYRFQGAQNVRTFHYGMLPFIEFRGTGVPREDFGLPGDVYIDTTAGAEALYYCTLGPAHARGAWERWDGTYPPPRHPYLCDEARYPRYLWVQPKATTWASGMFLAGLSQEILHPHTFPHPTGAEAQRLGLRADIVDMLARDRAPTMSGKRGRPRIKQEPGDGAGASATGSAPQKRKRKRESELLPVVPQRRAAAAAAAKIMSSAPQMMNAPSGQSVESALSTPVARHPPMPPPLPSISQPGRAAKNPQPTLPPPFPADPAFSVTTPVASMRVPLPRRKPTATATSLNNVLTQLRSISEAINSPDNLDTTRLGADVQKAVNSLDESRRRVDAREKEITEALRTKERALVDAQSERAKLVTVVQTLQKEFAKIFAPAWRASMNPAQLSDTRLNYENNILKVMPPRRPTELDKAKDRIAELERELEAMRVQGRTPQLPPPPPPPPPPLLFPVKLEPKIITPLQFTDDASGEMSRAGSEVDLLEDMVLEYPD